MPLLNPKDRASLMALGFQPLEATELIRMLVSLESAEKCGKSHWALSAPGPIAYFNFDVGLEGVDRKFTDRDILVENFQAAADLEGDISEVKAAAIAVRDKFLTMYKAALGKVKTIVVDTSSECWEIFRLAEFGKLTQVRSHHYATVNMQYKRLWRMAYDTPGQNLIMVHKLKPVYSGEVRTGEMERAGYSDAGYDAQVILRLFKDAPTEFGMRIHQCRINPALEGQEYRGATNSWEFLETLVIGG